MYFVVVPARETSNFTFYGGRKNARGRYSLSLFLFFFSQTENSIPEKRLLPKSNEME